MQSNDIQSSQLTDMGNHRQNHHHRHHYHCDQTSIGEFDGSDECSIDSGSSSSNDSSRQLSRRSSDERSGKSAKLLENHCHQKRLRATKRSTRSQDRRGQRSSERGWNPTDVRSLSQAGVSSYSFSLSDAHSSNSNSSNSNSSNSNSSSSSSSSNSGSFKRPFITETLRRAFQSLTVTSSKQDDSAKKKKHAKKSPKRILRRPVLYMYMRGPSGIPTQRVPRSSLQRIQPCSSNDLIGLYR